LPARLAGRSAEVESAPHTLSFPPPIVTLSSPFFNRLFILSTSLRSGDSSSLRTPPPPPSVLLYPGPVGRGAVSPNTLAAEHLFNSILSGNSGRFSFFDLFCVFLVGGCPPPHLSLPILFFHPLETDGVSSFPRHLYSWTLSPACDCAREGTVSFTPLSPKLSAVHFDDFFRLFPWPSFPCPFLLVKVIPFTEVFQTPSTRPRTHWFLFSPCPPQSFESAINSAVPGRHFP